MNETGTLSTRNLSMIAVLSVLVLVNALLETVPALALPVIQQGLHITPAQGGLLIAALTLTAAISTPIIGKLGDGYGPRRVLFAVMAVVTVGTVVSGAGLSFPTMLVGEVMQGLGAGLLSLTFTLMRSLLPGKWIKGVVGGVTAMYALGATINLMVAGPVSALLSWHALFFLPGALGALATVASWFLVPATPRTRDIARPKLGWPGALSFAAFLVALILAIESIPRMGLATVGAAVTVVVVLVLGAGWLVTEHRSRVPFVPLTLIRRRGMWTANAIALVQGIGSVVVTILLPQLITLPKDSGVGLGGSLTAVGLYLLPSSIAGILSTPLGGVLGQWIGSRTVVAVGTVLALAGTMGLVFAHGGVWQLLLATVVFGIGIGSASAAMYNLVISASSSDQTGLSTGLSNLMRAIGVGLGSVITTTILTADADPTTHQATATGFGTAFLVCAATFVVGVAITFAIPAARRDSSTVELVSGETVRAERSSA